MKHEIKTKYYFRTIFKFSAFTKTNYGKSKYQIHKAGMFIDPKKLYR